MAMLTNTNNYENIEVLIRRDQNTVLGRDGWKVHIQPQKGSWIFRQLPFGVSDVEKKFPSYVVAFRDDYLKGITISNPCITKAWDKEQAEKIAEQVRSWIDLQAGKKRIRQIRDALNKCKNTKKLERIAEILGV